MDRLLVRLRGKAAAEVHYARNAHAMLRVRLREGENDLARAESAGHGQLVAWLIEDRAALKVELRRIGRTLREARDRLRVLDTTLGRFSPDSPLPLVREQSDWPHESPRR